MSKLSFRARSLDSNKPLPIYRSDEIPDADSSLINRAVPQMPTGMEKEEESEHHLQRAICGGSVIPTPEVFDIDDLAYYNKLYPEDYKMPRQLIYMQPFTMEADIPDYDMDSEDEIWVNSQAAKLELTPDKFEEMMDRLEKGSGQTVVTLQEAKALIKEDDDLIIAVYDYWLNKRLKTQHPLIPQVRTEARFGVSNHNPYIAFRRRTEKMQTRKNRKNDESSYEKMLKLKRDLTRAVTLLEMVKRREKSKRELLHLTIEVFEKRFQAGDFSGQVVSDALSARPMRPAFTPLFQTNSMGWAKDDNLTVSSLTRKEKRHYKKRRHKSSTKTQASSSAVSSTPLVYSTSQALGSTEGDFVSSEEEVNVQGSLSEEEEEDEGPYAFKRKKNCEYHAPVEGGNWFWCSKAEGGLGDKRFRFCPTSISNVRGPGYRNVGMARRRVGRGGRVILDRMSYRNEDDFWRTMGYSVMDSASPTTSANNSSVVNPFPHLLPIEPNGVYPKPSGLIPPVTSSSNSFSFANAYSEEQKSCLHFRPKTPEELPPDKLRIPSEAMIVSSDDDLEVEDSYNKDMGVVKSKPDLGLGPYLGAVVSTGERPLIFETRTLLEDPLIYNKTAESDSFSNDLVLLDEQSSDISNAYYLLSCENPDFSESPFDDSWFSSCERTTAPVTTSSSSSSTSTTTNSTTTTTTTTSSSSNSKHPPFSFDFGNTKIKDEPMDPSETHKPVPVSKPSSSHDHSSNGPPLSAASKNGMIRLVDIDTSSSSHHDGTMEEEVIETVVKSGEMDFIVHQTDSSDSSDEKRRTSVDKDDKENNDRISSIRDRGGGGGDIMLENGDGVNSSGSSVDSPDEERVSNEEVSRTPNNNNIINVNSSRSSSTFQLVVDSSGLGPVVGEGLENNSVVAKSVVVGDSNSSSTPNSKNRTNGLQLVNMKNYGGSPEKNLCHIIT